MHTFSDFMYHLKCMQSRVLQFFHVLPFFWCPLTKCYTSNAHYRSKYLSEFFLLCLYYLYTAFQFVRLTILGELNRIHVLYVVFLTLTILLVQNFLIIWKLSDGIALLNKTILFGRRVCRKCLKEIVFYEKLCTSV